MIRRPPSAIPLQQDDVHEMEAFLAERRAALEAAEQEEVMQVEAQQQRQAGKSKGKGKANATKANSKGKQRAEQTNGGDALVEAEEQARLAREAQTREQRIGL